MIGTLGKIRLSNTAQGTAKRISNGIGSRLKWALGVPAICAFMWATSAAIASAQTPILTAPEAAQRTSTGGIVLLDIRSPEEWKETGLAQGAWPISMHTPDFPKQLQSVLANYRPDQIGLICATGGRSSYVAEILEKNGISGVADVSEGMFGNGTAKGWIARGLPVVTLEAAQARFKAVQDTWE